MNTISKHIKNTNHIKNMQNNSEILSDDITENKENKEQPSKRQKKV